MSFEFESHSIRCKECRRWVEGKDGAKLCKEGQQLWKAPEAPQTANDIIHRKPRRVVDTSHL